MASHWLGRMRLKWPIICGAKSRLSQPNLMLEVLPCGVQNTFAALVNFLSVIAGVFNAHQSFCYYYTSSSEPISLSHIGSVVFSVSTSVGGMLWSLCKNPLMIIQGNMDAARHICT